MTEGDPPGWEEERVLELFDSLSNWGRWGKDDQLGTLNLITAETRLAAASEVRLGRSLAVGRVISTRAGPDNPRPARHRIQELAPGAISCGDSLEIGIHGMANSHLDALGHEFFQGRMYNGRSPERELGRNGLAWADILNQGQGIFTRGVLLDVCRARGVEWLRPGSRITDADLDRAERLSGARVGAGDAVLVHCGHDRARRAGVVGEPGVRAGLGPECLPWLSRRQVSVFSGDCIEQLPSPYPRIPYPLHQVGIASMGLVLLDSVRLDGLAELCLELGRWSFLLTAAPLLIPGGTGSPVNPTCSF